MYLQFADIINQAYDRLESNEGREGTLVLDLPQLEDWLISKFQDLGFSIDTKTDFFAAGIDSLKAVQMRGLIIKYLALGGKGTSLASMAIYESGNVQNLAKKLLDLRTGDHKGDGEDDIKLMEELIERYSTLPKFVPKQGEGSGKAVVVSTSPYHRINLTIPGPYRSNWFSRRSRSRRTSIQPNSHESHLSRSQLFPTRRCAPILRSAGELPPAHHPISKSFRHRCFSSGS